jgi:hypothetical protein
LPIIWIGVREGYAGVAVGLLVVQLALVAVTTYIGSDTSDFYVFQTLMLLLGGTGLLLGAVTSERRIATQTLSEQQIELARMSAYAKAGAMGTALAHELSQPLSNVAAYLHAVFGNVTEPEGEVRLDDKKRNRFSRKPGSPHEERLISAYRRRRRLAKGAKLSKDCAPPDLYLGNVSV